VDLYGAYHLRKTSNALCWIILSQSDAE